MNKKTLPEQMPNEFPAVIRSSQEFRQLSEILEFWPSGYEIPKAALLEKEEGTAIFNLWVYLDSQSDPAFDAIKKRMEKRYNEIGRKHRETKELELMQKENEFISYAIQMCPGGFSLDMNRKEISCWGMGPEREGTATTEPRITASISRAILEYARHFAPQEGETPAMRSMEQWQVNLEAKRKELGILPL